MEAEVVEILYSAKYGPKPVNNMKIWETTAHKIRNDIHQEIWMLARVGHWNRQRYTYGTTEVTNSKVQPQKT